MKKLTPILLFSMLVTLSSCVAIDKFNHKIGREATPGNGIQENDLVKVTASRLNLRECASTKCSRIEQLPHNTKLLVLNKKGSNWIEVKHTNGLLRGWVSTKYVTLIRSGKHPAVDTNEDKGELLSDDFLSKDSEIQPIAPIDHQNAKSVTKQSEPPALDHSTTIKTSNTSSDENEVKSHDEITEQPPSSPENVFPPPDTAQINLPSSNDKTTEKITDSRSAPPQPAIIEETAPGINDEFM